ncbi:MAG: response regulator [Janthinobacterium sp.]
MTTTSTSGSNTPTQSIHGHQAKIMVVDDDVRLRDLLRRYLTEQGFNVFTAESATAMNKLWLRERYDLLVLDLMLPGEDGLSICRRLRGAGDQTPIIMLTAKGEDVDLFAETVRAA